MEESIVIPLGMFAMITLIVWMFQFFAAKKRIEAFQTLRLAIEKGQPLTPESLAAMSRIAPAKADLRRGIVFIAIAAAFGALAAILGIGTNAEMQESVRPILGVGVFPLSIGLAFLGLHAFAGDKS